MCIHVYSKIILVSKSLSMLYYKKEIETSKIYGVRKNRRWIICTLSWMKTFAENKDFNRGKYFIPIS